MQGPLYEVAITLSCWHEHHAATLEISTMLEELNAVITYLICSQYILMA